MKRRFLIAAFGAALLWTAPAKAQDPLLPTTPEAEPSAQIWRWRVQPAVGSRYQVRLFSRVQSKFPATEEEPALSVTSTVKMTAQLEALGRDAAGATKMRLTVRSIAGSAQINEGVSAEQRHVAENRLKYANARTAHAMIGQSLQFTLSPDGTVTQLEDREFSSRTLHVINSLQTESPVYGMVKNFGYSMPALFLAPVPKDALRVGQAWPGATLLPSPGNSIVHLDGQRTLKSLSGGVALLAEKSQVSAPAELAEMLPYNISGQTNGTARIDMSSGMPLEINTELRLQPELMDSNAQSQFEMRSTQEISQSRVVFEPMS